MILLVKELNNCNPQKNRILENEKVWARTVKPSKKNNPTAASESAKKETKKENVKPEEKTGRTFAKPLGKNASKATGAGKPLAKNAKKTFAKATTTGASGKIVLQQFIVAEEAELMKYLIAQLPGKSRDNIKSLLKNRLVSINGIAQSQFNLILTPGTKISIGKKTPRADTAVLSLKIFHEDDDIIVIEKPAGLLTMGSDRERIKTAYSQLSTYVKAQDEDNRIFIVHRLDRDTSGLLVFAKNEDAKHILQENWNDSIIERTYVALVEGKTPKESDTVISYLKESKALIVHSSKNPSYGVKAVTHYKVIEKRTNSTLVELNLETGRKNQIRVHMQEIGNPIVGDKKYGAKTNNIGRLALHAKILAFTHPITLEELRFETPVPRQFYL